jgi:hypothetical protein
MSAHGIEPCETKKQKLKYKTFLPCRQKIKKAGTNNELPRTSIIQLPTFPSSLTSASHSKNIPINQQAIENKNYYQYLYNIISKIEIY